WQAVAKRLPDTHRKEVVAAPSVLLPQARCVFVLAYPTYYATGWTREQAVVSGYYFASQAAYRATEQLAVWLREKGVAAMATASLPAKACAWRAGLGVYGRNTLLRVEPFGNALTLRTVVADVPLLIHASPVEDEMEATERHCGSCMRCVRACPTGALDGRGGLDVTRCLRAHMMSGLPIPEAFRVLMGTRLLGCEICQQVCPYNADAPTRPAENTAPFALAGLLAAETRTAQTRKIGALIGHNEARPQRVLAQAALITGNVGDTDYIPLLEALRTHENPVICDHAAWAIKQLKKR
ncbi:MAG: 4Fe-4S double cluster binding domain-containing protein, partial [Clostridia bacterium]